MKLVMRINMSRINTVADLEDVLRRASLRVRAEWPLREDLTLPLLASDGEQVGVVRTEGKDVEEPWP